MEFTKKKTKRELALEKGTSIDYCEFHLVHLKKKSAKHPDWECMVELVYKKREENPIEDTYLVGRLIEILEEKKVIPKREQKKIDFVIKSIRVLKHMGYGSYEQA